MPAQKDARRISSSPRSYSSHRELQVLYARRSAIDRLIESLQSYDRFRAKCSGTPDRKLA